MTSKLSFITFIPFTLLAVAARVASLFFLDENGLFMGLNAFTLSYVSIACALFVLLFAVIFCLVDKKTASVYEIKRNIPASIFGILLAVLLACDGANRAFVAIRSATFSFLEITEISLTVLCAVVFVVLGLNHFVGNGGVKGISVFYLVPALWSAFRLVVCFLDFTTVSVMVSDVSILACYIFSTLFLFNYAMIIALMKGKSPVRSALIYGMPAVTMLMSYSVYEISKTFRYGVSSFTLFDSLPVFEFALLALYILSFIIEMSIFVKKKEEIEFLEEENEEVYEDVDDPDSDIIKALGNSVTNGNEPDEIVDESEREGFNSDHLAIDDEVFIEVAQASMNNFDSDSDDKLDYKSFVYGNVPSDDEFILPINKGDNDENVVETKMVDESDNMFITDEDGSYFEEEDEVDKKIEDVDARLDRIDKLILEITEDN